MKILHISISSAVQENELRSFYNAALNGKVDELAYLAAEQMGDKIKSKLMEIVPEYNAMG